MMYNFDGNELNDVLKVIIEEAKNNNIKVTDFGEGEKKHVYRFVLKDKPKYELIINKFLSSIYHDKTYINFHLILPSNDEVYSCDYSVSGKSETVALFNKAFDLIKEINKNTNKKFLYEFLRRN